MGPNVRGEGPVLVHDLMRVREPAAVTADGPVPPWVEAVVGRTPWVVVRRGRIQGGAIPVGVRGRERSQRFPAWLLVADVAERRSPEAAVGQCSKPADAGFSARSRAGTHGGWCRLWPRWPGSHTSWRAVDTAGDLAAVSALSWRRLKRRPPRRATSTSFCVAPPARAGRGARPASRLG